MSNTADDIAAGELMCPSKDCDGLAVQSVSAMHAIIVWVQMNIRPRRHHMVRRSRTAPCRDLQ